MAALRVLAWQRKVAREGQRALLNLLRKQDEALQKIIAQSAKNAGQIISSLPGEGVGSSVRTFQYQQARASLVELTAQMWGDDIAAQILMDIGTSAQMAANDSRQILQVLTRGVGPGQAGILANSMLSSAARTFQDVRSRLLNSVDLSPNIYRAEAYTMGKIDAIVNEGIALGQSAREIATNVSGFINPSAPGGVRYSASRLGRTELNNAYHATSIRSYQESPYVRGVQWVISGSHPTDDECDEYAEIDESGLGSGVFLPDEVPFKPHPQCFCYIIPITPTPEEFVNDMQNGEFSCGGV